MKNYQNHTLQEYLRVLSSRTPVPGGGSAAALVGSLGMALISMVARYSINRAPPRLAVARQQRGRRPRINRNHSKTTEIKIKNVLRQSEALGKRLLQLVDRDAQAYKKVVKARKAHPVKKRAALREARRVPREAARLCGQGMPLAAFLVKKGNKYLRSDARLAIEFLQSALRASKINVEINQ